MVSANKQQENKQLPKLLLPAVAAIIIIIFLAGILLLLPQSEPPVNPPNDPQPREVKDAGFINARVFDELGVPLNEAEVFEKELLIAKTNSEGYANFKVTQSDRVVLSFSKSGMIPNFRAVEIKKDETTFVTITLRAKSEAVSVDTAQGGTITQNKGVVEIPSSAMVFEDGSPVTGEVDVFVNFFDAGNESDLEQFPGDFQGLDSSDNEQTIESFGFVYVDAEKDGKKVNLNGEATIKILIPEGTEADETNGLWYFDEEKGIWTETGEMVKECDDTGCYYVASIAHFSFWNCDKIIEVISVIGKVIEESDVVKDGIFTILGLMFPELKVALIVAQVTYEVVVQDKSVKEAVKGAAMGLFMGKAAKSLGVSDEAWDAFNAGKSFYGDVGKATGYAMGNAFQSSDSGAWTPSNVSNDIYNGVRDRLNKPFSQDSELMVATDSVDFEVKSIPLDEARTFDVEYDEELLRQAIEKMTPSLMEDFENKVGKYPGASLYDWEIDNVAEQFEKDFFQKVMAKLVLDMSDKEAKAVFADSHGNKQGTEEILSKLGQGVVAVEESFRNGEIVKADNVQVIATGIDYSSTVKQNTWDTGEFVIQVKKNSKVELNAFKPGYVAIPFEVNTDNRNVLISDDPSKYQQTLPILLVKPQKKVAIILDVSGSMAWPFDIPDGFVYNDIDKETALEHFKFLESGVSDKITIDDLMTEAEIDEYTYALVSYLEENNLPKENYIRLDAAKKALKDSIDLLEENNYAVSLVLFSNYVNIASVLTFDYALLNQKIDSITIGFGTDIDNGLRQGLGVLGNEGGVVILMTDGRDENSRKKIIENDYYKKNVIDIAKEANIKVCTVGIGLPQGVDTELLEFIAKNTTCDYQFGGSINKIKSAIMKEIYTQSRMVFETESLELEAGATQIVSRFNVDVGTTSLQVRVVTSGSIEVILTDTTGQITKQQGDASAPIILELQNPSSKQYTVEVKNLAENKVNYTATISSQGKSLQPL